MKLELSQLRRIEKLELSIHDLCEKDACDPDHYLDILQRIKDNPNHQIKIAKSQAFVSLAEQYQGFLDYNKWLEDKHLPNTIPDKHLAVLQRDLIPKAFSDALIFYCHQSDVILTAKLAWEYICSYREKTWKSNSIRFEADYMKLADNEPARPNGFYIMKRPPEDEEAIGKKFQNRKVEDVREELGNDWGMACEGIQFVGVTHKYYPELMDGDKVPFIDLPGLAIRLGASGAFFDAPFLSFGGGVLRLGCGHVGFASPEYGSGSLQQC